MNAKRTNFLQTAAAIAAGVTAAGLSTMAYAQDALPPADAQAAAAQDSNVYNWKDVPTNQQVVIDRAVFDQGGYQLYCHTGETIVVPFVDHNLYVMKFGRSDGGMYFVNEGATPTLYVPQGGYLENAAAEGARWYPFPPDYTYTIPIYISVAPDWDDYVGMAWYPDMGCYGGYWGRRSYAVGVAAYAPLPGFYFTIYDHPYYGWSSYHAYYVIHSENRVFFRTAPVYRYDQFPARGAAYYGHNYPFRAARPFGSQDHSENGGSGRSAPGSPSAVWGTPHFDRNSAPVPAFGSHVPFGSRAASSSPLSTPAIAGSHTPFGGAGTSSAVPGSVAHHYWGDGSPRTWPSSSSSGYSSGAGSSHASWGGGGVHSSSSGSEHSSSSSQSHSGDKSSNSSGDSNKKKP